MRLCEDCFLFFWSSKHRQIHLQSMEPNGTSPSIWHCTVTRRCSPRLARQRFSDWAHIRRQASRSIQYAHKAGHRTSFCPRSSRIRRLSRYRVITTTPSYITLRYREVFASAQQWIDWSFTHFLTAWLETCTPATKFMLKGIINFFSSIHKIPRHR